MFRYPVSCLLTCFLSCQLAFAQAQPSGENLPLSDPKIAAVCEAIGLNSKLRAPWAIVEFGPSGHNLKMEGWLLRDDPDSVMLFVCSGEVAVLRRPGPHEVRPKSSHGLNELFWQEWRVAWSIKPGDFEAYCRTLLKKGLPEPDSIGPWDAKGKPVGTPRGLDLALGETLISGCLLGYVANRSGNPELSHDLFTLAAAAHHRLSMFPLGSKRDFFQHFVNRTADRMRNNALTAAIRGVPRPDLLQAWEIIAKLPLESAAAEAKVMVEGYKSLIEEDRVWQEPKWLTTLSTEQKIAYWMYHLRDLDDSMYGGAGVVSAKSSPHRILQEFLLPPPSPPKINPAVELKKLGIAALPTIIAHIDDTRPTRAGFVLRYGDCCQQIFEGITKHTIHEMRWDDEYPVQMGQEKLCKQRAEKWWAEYQRLGK